MNVTNIILIVLLSILGLEPKEDCSLTYIVNHESSFEFIYYENYDNDEYTSSCKRRLYTKENKNRKKAHIVKENKKIYLNVEPKPSIDIYDYFIENSGKKVKTLATPLVVIALIIDENGKIIEKGFLRPSLDEHYNDVTIQTLKKIEKEIEFLPAKIRKTPVACLYTIAINYRDPNREGFQY